MVRAAIATTNLLVLTVARKLKKQTVPNVQYFWLFGQFYNADQQLFVTERCRRQAVP